MGQTTQVTSSPNENDQDQDRPFEIRFAPRVYRLPPYLFARINGLLYQKRRAGNDVIDLGMGNPSDPPQDIVIRKLAEAAADPDNHGYSKSNGILNLRREVASTPLWPTSLTGDDALRLVAGLLFYATLIWLHPAVIGVSPLP